MFCHADGADFPDSEFERRGAHLWHKGHLADGSGSGVDPAARDDLPVDDAADGENRGDARP